MNYVEAAARLIEVSRAERGGSPRYGPYKAFLALKIIGSSSLGRLRLAHMLGLGEASARTLLQRLKEANLIISKERGVELSEVGKEILRQIESAITVRRAGLPFPGWERSLILLLKGLSEPRDLVDVYRARDWVVMEGCNEAIIGGLADRRIEFPGLPDEVASQIAPHVPREGSGLLLVVPERCEEMAMNAAIKMLAAQQRLIKNN